MTKIKTKKVSGFNDKTLANLAETAKIEGLPEKLIKMREDLNSGFSQEMVDAGIQKRIEDGSLANMTILDNSITTEKLGTDVLDYINDKSIQQYFSYSNLALNAERLEYKKAGVVGGAHEIVDDSTNTYDMMKITLPAGLYHLISDLEGTATLLHKKITDAKLSGTTIRGNYPLLINSEELFYIPVPHGGSLKIYDTSKRREDTLLLDEFSNLSLSTYERTNNLFDMEQVMDKYYINPSPSSTKAEFTYADFPDVWWVSGLIDVRSVNGYIYFNDGYRYFALDDDLKVTGPIGGFADKVDVTNVSYLIIGSSKGNQSKYAMVSTVNGLKYEHYYKDIKPVTAKPTDTYNLFNKNEVVRNTIIDGAGTGKNAGSFVTGWMKCEYGETVSSKYTHGQIEFADDNKTRISKIQNAYKFKDVPAGATLFRMSFSCQEAGSSSATALNIPMEDVINDLVICRGSGAELPRIDSTVNSIDPVLLPRGTTPSYMIKTGWYGKEGDSLGDSITQQQMYQMFVSSYFGLKAYHALGIGGTKVSGISNDAFWQDVRVNSLSLTSFFCTIFGGTNDGSDGGSGITPSNIGDINIDNCDTNTFVGAYNVLISKIYYKYYKLGDGLYSSIDYSGVTQVDVANPKFRIILITPPYGGDFKSSYGIKPYADAVKEIGAMWNLPVADVYYNSGLNKLSNDNSIFWSATDKTHPNAEGHKRIAEVIIGKMKEVEPFEFK